jgi:hypothetical protein
MLRREPGATLIALALGCGGDDEIVSGGSTETAASADSNGSSDATTPASTGLVESSSDDGVDASSTSLTTGVPTACGDGMREGLEQCDGDDPPGAECGPDCLLPSGETVWTVAVDSGDDDVAADVAVRANGEIVVVGSRRAAQGRDAWIAAYGPGGDALGEMVLDFGAGDDDELAAVGMRDGGMVVVGSATAGSGETANTDVLVVALDDALATVWQDRFDGGLDDVGQELAIADAGEVVVVGSSATMDTLGDAWIRRYDADGNELWTHSVDGAGSRADVANAVAVTGDGRIVVVGALSPSIETDLWISTLDGDGDEQWGALLDFEFGDDYAAGVTIDGDAIWVTGSISSALTNSEEAWVARYDGAGTQGWSTSWNSNGFVFDSGEDVVADGADVWIAGITAAPDQQRNALAGRFQEPMAAPLWVHSTDGGPGLGDAAHGIARLSDGSVVVVGELTVLGQGTDAWIRRYAP